MLLLPAFTQHSTEPASIASIGVRAKFLPLGKKECRSHHVSATATMTRLATAVNVGEDLMVE